MLVRLLRVTIAAFPYYRVCPQMGPQGERPRRDVPSPQPGRSLLCLCLSVDQVMDRLACPHLIETKQVRRVRCRRQSTRALLEETERPYLAPQPVGAVS